MRDFWQLVEITMNSLSSADPWAAHRCFSSSSGRSRFQISHLEHIECRRGERHRSAIARTPDRVGAPDAGIGATVASLYLIDVKMSSCRRR
jgi:hypothetical protein